MSEKKPPMSDETEDYKRTQYGWSDGFTECDLHYARELKKALNEYYDAGPCLEQASWRMSDLLPCPFCGQINEKVVDATRIFGVFNLNHHCRVVGFVELSHPSPDGVVELWNTRAAHLAEVERLRADLAASRRTAAVFWNYVPEDLRKEVVKLIAEAEGL